MRHCVMVLLLQQCFFCFGVPKNIAGTFVSLVVLCECAVVPYETSGNLSRCILSSDTIAAASSLS